MGYEKILVKKLDASNDRSLSSMETSLIDHRRLILVVVAFCAISCAGIVRTGIAQSISDRDHTNPNCSIALAEAAKLKVLNAHLERFFESCRTQLKSKQARKAHR